MAEGKREYIAMFSIGARLLGSFKGVMNQAHARLRLLRRQSMSLRGAFAGISKGVGTVFKGVAVGLAGMVAGALTSAVSVVAYNIGSIIKSLFESAAANAEQAAERQRTLMAYLRTDRDFRKQGTMFMENQIQLLDQHNEKLSEQTKMSQDIYDQSNKTLIKYGMMPRKLAEMAGPMGDMLAVSKGPRASMEDMASLSEQIGYAIEGGPTKQLERLDVLGEEVRKNWSKMSKEMRYQKILKGLKKFEGEAKKAMETPVGRIQQFHNSMDDLSSELGEVLLPHLANVADMWRAFVEMPAFRGLLLSGAKAFVGILGKITTYLTNDLIPALNRMTESPAFAQMMTAAGAFFSFMGEQIIKLGEDFGEMWYSTLQELEVLLIGLSAISDKFKPALESVVTMRREIELGKMLATKPMLPPEALMVPPPAAKVDVSAAALLKGTGLEDLKTYKQVQQDIMADQARMAAIKPSADAREWWQTAADGIAQVDQTLGTFSANVDATIATGLKVPFEALKTNIAAVKGDWQGMNEHAANTQTEVKTALSGIGQAIVAAFTQPLTDAKMAWDNLKSAMSSGLPAVTPIAAPVAAATPAPATAPIAQQFGGIHTKPTLAMLGEAGPEAVIPLPKGLRALGAGSPTTLNFTPQVTINGNATEAEQRAMDTKLRDLAKDFIAQFKAAQYQERRLSYESGYG